MKTIPPNRLIIYLLILGLLPLMTVIFYHFSEKAELNRLEKRMKKLYISLSQEKEKSSLNGKIYHYFRDTDPYYIDTNLETLVFLKNEIQNLKQITKDPSFPEMPAIKQRLNFLMKDNQLSFSEGMIQKYPYFKETQEIMKHPVELDLNDLHELLSKIENLTIDQYQPKIKPPQLLITDFNIERKICPNKNEVFILTMKILKREYF